MSTKYNHGHEVPTDILCNRLDELATAILKGRPSFEREFTMRIPAEMDRDPDLVLSEASRRIAILYERIKKILHTHIGDPDNLAANVMKKIAAGEYDAKDATL